MTHLYELIKLVITAIPDMLGVPRHVERGQAFKDSILCKNNSITFNSIILPNNLFRFHLP